VAREAPEGFRRSNEVSVSALHLVLQIILILTSLILTLLILLHKGRGGGLSDMFGGGMSSSIGSSGVAERNLNRFTIGISMLWVAVVVGLNLLTRFYPNL
jgi:preprotein translocase subunit SecG